MTFYDFRDTDICITCGLKTPLSEIVYENAGLRCRWCIELERLPEPRNKRLSKLEKYSKTTSRYFTGCRHWRQQVKVGKRFVTCSSYSGNGDRLEPLPDFGIYLSTLWWDKISPFWTSGAYIRRVSRMRQYPALVIDCPDMGALKPELLDELVEICLSKMRQGKRIDIGCNAGHGRTGMLVACLIVRKEHLTGEQAIAEVQHRYCSYAIETEIQKKAVSEYRRRQC